MKANVVRGNGFRGVLDYVADDEKCVGIVAGNMSGLTTRELSSEFSASRRLRPDAVRPVWHASLALPAGEDVSHEKWQQIAERFMEEMGMGQGHQWVGFKHEDTDYRHIHIVASRIGLDGSLWHGKWEARRAIEATQLLEREFGLTITPGLENASTKKRPSFNEIQKASRDGEPLPRIVLQEIVDAALEGESQSIFAFIERVEAAGAVALPNVAKTGKMNGFSFSIDGIAFKASQLGKGYSWKQLQQKGVVYEQDQDCDELIETAQRIKDGINQVNQPAAELGREVTGGNSAEGPRAGEEPGGSGRGDRAEPSPVAPTHQAGPGEDSVSDGNAVEQPGRIGRRTKEVSDQGKAVSRAPGAGWQPAFVEGMGRVHDMRVLRWDRVHHFTSDLAAPLDRSPVVGQSVDEMKPDHRAKVLAWREQHKALQSPFYRITAKPRAEDRKTINFGKQREGGEIQYDAAQVENLIPRLRQKNALGYDIYVTPLDPNNHYLVVDDLTKAKLDELRKDTKLSPCLIQRSSKDNYQAIIKAEKKSRSDEQSIANDLVQRINRKYGDPKFTGVIHPFRMAGFANKKPGRNNVFTRVIEAAGKVCDYASQLLEHARSKIDAERRRQAEAKRQAETQQEHQHRLAGIETQADHTAGNVVGEYRKAWRRHAGLAKAQGWQLDYSVLDYRIAVDLMREGHDAAEVGHAIIMASPQLSERHGSDPEGYAARTIGKARIEAEKAAQGRSAAQEAQRPEQDWKPGSDPGPEM